MSPKLEGSEGFGSNNFDYAYDKEKNEIPSYEDLDNIRREFVSMNKLDQNNNFVSDNKEANKAYFKMREKYVDSLEKVYNQFTKEYGPVKSATISEYLESRMNFIHFLYDKKMGYPIHYDLGYRFQIDTLLNDKSIPENENKTIRNILMNISPNCDMDTNKVKNETNLKNFTKKEAEKILQIIVSLNKKSKKQAMSIDIPFSILNNDQFLREWIEDYVRDKIPNEKERYPGETENKISIKISNNLEKQFSDNIIKFTSFDEKYTSFLDCDLNSSIREKYFSEIIYILQKTSGSGIRSKEIDDNDLVRELYQDIKKEFNVEIDPRKINLLKLAENKGNKWYDKLFKKV